VEVLVRKYTIYTGNPEGTVENGKIVNEQQNCA
jgi:hypothetical protein